MDRNDNMFSQIRSIFFHITRGDLQMHPNSKIDEKEYLFQILKANTKEKGSKMIPFWLKIIDSWLRCQ
jgi:hypothetical protein